MYKKHRSSCGKTEEILIGEPMTTLAFVCYMTFMRHGLPQTDYWNVIGRGQLREDVLIISWHNQSFRIDKNGMFNSSNLRIKMHTDRTFFSVETGSFNNKQVYYCFKN